MINVQVCTSLWQYFLSAFTLKMGTDPKSLESEFVSKDSEDWRLTLTTDEAVSLKKLVSKIWSSAL